MAKQKLPAIERIVILAGRLDNLSRGRGSFPTPGHRQQAIDAADDALREAMADLVKESAH